MDQGGIHLPVVEISVRYRKSVRFDERVGETVLGVAIAAVFGMAGSRRERPG